MFQESEEMLVLSRKTNETIVFPDLGITVDVIRVKGNRIRLGVTAPDAVRILRGELLAAAIEVEVSDEETISSQHFDAVA